MSQFSAVLKNEHSVELRLKLTPPDKDCQDQIKSPTGSECLKYSLINSDSLNIFSRMAKLVLLGRSQILGLAYKLGYGTAGLVASS